tara:strand:+ start:171 stop:902 length:732 start_codon:yes stop_codon:yes gene_type:complete
MIFNLFKSKPTLNQLIPKGFVDIHSHILPGIDDGPNNIEESIELISEMKKLGFSKIIGTPHTYPGLYENTNLSIENSYESINIKKIKGIKIDYASEYMADISIIEKLKKNTILTLKDDYVLIETGFISYPNSFEEIIFQIRSYGYKPILAHPERYRYLNSKRNLIYKLKKIGCRLQINLFSLTDYYGKDVRIMCEKLLKEDLIDFVGSDIHNIKQCKEFDKQIRINKTNNILKAIENNCEIFG